MTPLRLAQKECACLQNGRCEQVLIKNGENLATGHEGHCVLRNGVQCKVFEADVLPMAMSATDPKRKSEYAEAAETYYRRTGKYAPTVNGKSCPDCSTGSGTCVISRAETLSTGVVEWSTCTNLPATSNLMMHSVALTNASGFYRVGRAFSLTDGLLAYFPFDGHPDDTSGNGYTGEVYQATLTADRFGNTNRAYFFDGIDDYIRTPADQRLEPDTEITLACWIKPSYSVTDHSRCYRILRKAGHNAAGYLLSWSNFDNLLALRLGSAGALDVHVKTPNAPYVGAWHHVAATYSEITREGCLYVDGALVDAAINQTYTMQHSDDLFYIGGWPNGANGRPETYPGAIDEVRVYDRVLSSNEVWDLYSQEAQ